MDKFRGLSTAVPALGVLDLKLEDAGGTGEDVPLDTGIFVISTRSTIGEDRSLLPLFFFFLSIVSPAGIGGVMSLDEPEIFAAKAA